MLPDTTGRFGLMQIFDWDGWPSHTPMTNSEIQAEAPYEDLVWGAFSPGVWDAAHPGMYVSRYMLPVEDNNSVSGHDLSWWQNNHPDWILYACDSSGNPTKQLAWAYTDFPDVPLNFDNPAVEQYQMGMMIKYLKANGYNTLAVDNTDLLNYLTGGNPNFGQSHIQGYYGCGYYDTSGSFHKIFGPGNDPTFIADMVKWVQNAGSALHAAGLKLIINHPLYNAPTNSNEEAMLSAVDGTVDENGFTHYGQYGDPQKVSTPNLVASTVQWAEYSQEHHVAFLVSDYFCSGYNGTEDWNNNAPCNSDPLTLPAPQVDWALSTYALVNEGGLDVYISPESGANRSYRPEYNTRYGTACAGGYTQISSNVYERKFSGALVIVNANTPPSSFSVTLPSGHTYKDIENRSVSNPLQVNGADGYVLLTSNGCS